MTGCGWRPIGGSAAADDAGRERVIEELTDRYGPLPEPARRLVAVACLRLLCRQYGVTDVGATGTGSGTTIRVALRCPTGPAAASSPGVSAWLSGDDRHGAGADPREGSGIGAPPGSAISRWCRWWRLTCASGAFDGKPFKPRLIYITTFTATTGAGTGDER